MGFFKRATSTSGGAFFTRAAPNFTGPAAGTTNVTLGSAGVSVNIGTFTPLPDPFGRGRTVFSISGDLPPGVSFSSNGQISGTAVTANLNEASRTYTFDVTATEIQPNSSISTSVSRTFSITVTCPFKFRQVITTGYLLGGYQNGVLWNNVNRCVQSTDTTTNLGDGFIDNFHYKSGATTRTKQFVFNGTGVTAFNMRTEVRANSGSINFNGSNTCTVFDSVDQYNWVNGEGCGNWKRWTNATESISANLSGGWNSHAAGFSGENFAINWDNGGYTQRLQYSNETNQGMGHSAGAHGQQKGLGSKNYEGYGGNEGSYNGGYNFRVTNTETGAGITYITKPIQNMGEENFLIGQDHGYCLGTYDGSQNNRAFKLTYATRSGFEAGSTLQPKGKGGCSSGWCGHRD